MAYDVQILAGRVPIIPRWYQRVLCWLARPIIAFRCTNRTMRATAELPSLIQKAASLGSQETVHQKLGQPHYVLDGKGTGCTNKDGSFQRPDLIDVYTISHCTIDVCCIDGKVRQVMGTVSLDGWDVCSQEYLKRS